MTVLHRPAVQRWLATHVLCRVPEAGPRFSLTFDDGPSLLNTPRLLDTLARHGARATFFLLTGRARHEPELVRRMVDEGHEAGIHGSLHVPPWLLPRPLFVRELESSIAAVGGLSGRRPSHYRAPFGVLHPAQASWVRACGLTPVLGDVYPRDHEQRKASTIARLVLERLEPGSIVILHDSSALFDLDRRPTLEAVEAILDEAGQRGWRSVTVAELAGTSEEAR